MSAQVVAGIDIGETKIAVALADTDAHLISLSRFATQVERGPYHILEDAAKEIE